MRLSSNYLVSRMFGLKHISAIRNPWHGLGTRRLVDVEGYGQIVQQVIKCEGTITRLGNVLETFIPTADGFTPQEKEKKC